MEYAVVDVEELTRGGPFGPGCVAEGLNEMAAAGWRLQGTLLGGRRLLVFERRRAEGHHAARLRTDAGA